MSYIAFSNPKISKVLLQLLDKSFTASAPGFPVLSRGHAASKGGIIPISKCARSGKGHTNRGFIADVCQGTGRKAGGLLVQASTYS